MALNRNAVVQMNMIYAAQVFNINASHHIIPYAVIMDMLTVMVSVGLKINLVVIYLNTTVHTRMTTVFSTAAAIKMNLVVRKDKCVYPIKLSAVLLEKRNAILNVSQRQIIAAHKDKLFVNSPENVKLIVVMSGVDILGALTQKLVR